MDMEAAIASLSSLLEQQAERAADQNREMRQQLAALSVAVSTVTAAQNRQQQGSSGQGDHYHASIMRPLVGHVQAGRGGWSSRSPKAGPVLESNVNQVHPIGEVPAPQSEGRVHARSDVPSSGGEYDSTPPSPNSTGAASDGPYHGGSDVDQEVDPAQRGDGAQNRMLSRCATRNFSRIRAGELGSQFNETPKARTSKFSQIVWDVVLPQSALVQRFKAIILLLCIMTVIVVPFIVSFESRLKPAFSLMLLDITLALIEACFMADIHMNFRTAYYSTAAAQFITDRREIAFRYARGMLLIDVVSSLPVTIVWRFCMNGKHIHDGVLGTFAILQLVKMFKALNLQQLSTPLESFFGSAQVSFVRLIFYFFLVFHGTACGFHLVAMLGNDRNSWIAREGLIESQVVARYVSAMYWTFATVSTTGFGDIVPVSKRERVFAMGSMLLGLTVFSCFISSVSNIVSIINAASIRAANQRRVIDMFAEQNKLPRGIRRRIHSYFDYLHSNRSDHEADSALIESLSPQLRMDVRLFLYADIVSKIPFFRTKSAQFITELIPELRSEVFPPDEYVTVEGETGQKLYFVRSGLLQVRLAHNKAAFRRAFMLTRSVKGSRDLATARALEDDVMQTGRSIPLLQLLSSLVRRSTMMSFNAQGVRGGSEGECFSATHSEYTASEFAEELVWAQQILDQDHGVVQELRSGSYFGERACLQGTLRSASVVSLKYSETLTLSKVALDRVSKMFPKGSANAVTTKDVAGAISFRSFNKPTMHEADALPPTQTCDRHARRFNGADGTNHAGGADRGEDETLSCMPEHSNNMHNMHNADSLSPDGWVHHSFQQSQVDGDTGAEPADDPGEMHAPHALRRRSHAHSHGGSSGGGTNTGASSTPAVRNTLARSSVVDMRGDVHGPSVPTKGRRSKLSFKLAPGEHGTSQSSGDDSADFD